MEKYKASHNSKEVAEEVPEKSEKEQKEEATSKALDTAATIGLDAYTGGQFSKVKNGLSKIPGVGKMVDDKWNKTINKASKLVSKTPVGDLAKGLNDSGVTDTVKAGYDMYSGAKSGNSDSINKASGTSKNLGSLSKTTTSNSFMSDNIMSGIGGKSLKIKIILVICLILFFMIIITTLASGKDFENLDLTNQSTMTAKNPTPTAISVESRIIYVGSSNITGIQSNNPNNSISYLTDASANYDWLVNVSDSTLSNMISSKPNGIVVISLGNNDLHNIDNYINYYNELINKYPNIKFHFISVNPIDESAITTYTNQDVINFNTKLANAFPDNYINTYDELKNNNLIDNGSSNTNIYNKIHSVVNSKLNTLYASGDLLAKLEEVALWYISNIATYNQGLYVDNPFTTSTARADCTGFAAIYMSYVAGVTIPTSSSAEMVYHQGDWANSISNYGWKAYTTDEIGALMPGDVLVSNPVISYSKGNHAEVYVSETETFGWGSVKKSYPTKSTLQQSTKNGHTIYSDNVGKKNQHDYITVYRFEGGITSNNNSSNNSNNGNSNNVSLPINITKMYDSSFNHGNKSVQKYIMLHDTEMSQNAKTVVQSWKNSGNGVAAHFVVDRDGTVIQAVDLNTISHHAGWGGPGDFDSKFGVGNNDGKGNGDDLKGQKTTGWESYTSYGMNSYSVGIEMCHVNGEEYPEAQLNALDKVIEYIDSYFGFQSTIIDHKAWRPSNSDTDSKFATYLNNYKTLRHH